LDKNKEKSAEQPEVAKTEVAVMAAEPVVVKTEGVKFEDAAIIKKKNGEYAIRASYQGVELGMKPIDREPGNRYFLMPEGKEKQAILSAELNSKFGKEIVHSVRQESRSMKIG
jgi:hypothetical protein